MHMADALISPVVGGTMWIVSAGFIRYCSKKIDVLDDYRVPLMGVLGAFIFAAQMINFSIPGTGSSGHLGGGMILAILLGHYAAFIVIASVLVVQALFFADGGLLALGCNIFNMGFFPCFIAYPLIFKKIVGNKPTSSRLWFGATIAAIIGLQMGSVAVVGETVLSGISELPFRTFFLIMQPIHLAIGIVEGLVTATVVSFVWKTQPEVLKSVSQPASVSDNPTRRILFGFLLLAILTGGMLSRFASHSPDGLEWAISKTAKTEDLAVSEHGIHKIMTRFQKKTSLLPGYAFDATEHDSKTEDSNSLYIIDKGRTVSGITGGFLTLILVSLTGYILKRHKAVIQPTGNVKGSL